MPDEYAPFAARYDWMEPTVAWIRRALTRAVVEKGCTRVLDVCCGTGTQVFLLRRKGIPSFGVDLSPAMLEQVRRKTHGPYPVVRADARFLPFPAAVFDGLILSFAFHEKPSAVRRKMLEEARRVLVPEGILFVVDYLRGPTRGFGRGLSRLIERVERRAGKIHYTEFRRFMDHGGIERFLKANGLRIVDRRDYWRGNIGFVTAVWKKPV